jgi:putative ABC transport system permease protein
MFFNIIRVIFRNIQKHRFFTFINISGLTLGFAAFITISLFINYEFNWDTHNEKYNRIYRVQQTVNSSNESWSQVPPAVSQALKKYPEIEQSILIREGWGEYLSANGTDYFIQNDGYYASSDFFSVFTVDFIRGNAKTALEEPNAIALSETTAHKFFGDSNPMGKTLMLEKHYPLKVSAVYKDFPRNSHIQPEYLTEWGVFETFKNWKSVKEDWYSNAFRCYIVVKAGINVASLNKKIEGIYAQNKIDKVNLKPYIWPLSKVYLSPNGIDDYLAAIMTYCFIAVLILLLASINYINHTTAYATLRAKEIAVRKVSGSNKTLLVVQFLAESVISSIIACFLALVVVSLILPFFNQMIDRQLELYFQGAGTYYVALGCVTLLVGVLSGLYPAFFMSSVQSLSLLKGDVFKVRGVKGGIRKALVTFQFAASIIMLILTLFMNRQIVFTMHKDLGFAKDNLLFVDFGNAKDSISYDGIKNRLAKYPFITDVSLSENIPFKGSDGKIINWEGAQPNEKEDLRYNFVSHSFIKTFGLTIVKGRGFSEDTPSDIGKSCIINETAWKRFGWKNPIGKYVESKVSGKKWLVVGVVKDYHLYSVHNKIPPCMMELDAFSTKKGWMTITVRILPGQTQQAKAALKREIEACFPGSPFEVQDFSQNYKQDGIFKTYGIIKNTFLLFAIINICLTIFGLFGLVSFSIQCRTKEIGIRKINGSSVWSIFLMLNKDYSVLILFSVLLAWPFAYYFYFFTPFAYKAAINPVDFIVPTLIVFLISLLTTGYYTFKAATRNPIEALRYE